MLGPSLLPVPHLYNVVPWSISIDGRKSIRKFPNLLHPVDKFADAG